MKVIFVIAIIVLIIILFGGGNYHMDGTFFNHKKY